MHYKENLSYKKNHLFLRNCSSNFNCSSSLIEESITISYNCCNFFCSVLRKNFTLCELFDFDGALFDTLTDILFETLEMGYVQSLWVLHIDADPRISILFPFVLTQ